MIILQDSREQKPLAFSSPWVSEVRVQKLDVGDYGCIFEKDGHEPNIYFDRKSLGDLYGTMGTGYKRFKKVIIRAKERDTTMFIIVEGSLTRIGAGFNRSQIKGASMLLKLFTLWLRHGVQTIFCKDREEMSMYIVQFYIACGKEHYRRA